MKKTSDVIHQGNKEEFRIRTLRIDINPLRDFRYVATATRYATLDMFASQTRALVTHLIEFQNCP